MAPGELLIAQISDPHIRSAPDDANFARLERVLDHLAAMARRPDLLLVTGDLADETSEAPYRRLRDRLSALPFPAYVALGNHDVRGHAARIFARAPGFFHYAVEMPSLRLVVLDTLEEGRHGGAFCAERAAWLGARLTEAPDRPTLIALHHPPIDTGIDWLTTAPTEPWVSRLRAALAGHSRIVALVAGHIHRPIAADWAGWPVRVCPAAASPLTLDLAPLDPIAPDGRALVGDGPPGYALHLWRGGTLTTHVDWVAPQPVLARFDAAMQPKIAALFAERP